MTGLAVLGASLVLGAAVHKLGASALVLLAAGAVALLLLAHPAWSLGLLVGAVLLFEADPTSAFGFGSRLYEFIPGPKITGLDALLGLASAAVCLDVLRRRRTHPVGLVAAPLALLVCGVVMGAVTGLSAGVGLTEVQDGVRSFLPLLVIPLLTTQVLHTREDLHRALGALAAITAVKVTLGVALYATGASTPSADFSATYLESTTNVLTMLFLLGWTAARLARVPLPVWVQWLAPIAAACLLLSFRRSFWIATVAGGLLVLLLGTGQTGRRLLLPGLVVLGLAGYLVSATAVAQINGPVGERIQQLSPTKIKSNKEDRYRLGERRSVVADLRQDPIAGLGLGIPWRQRYPISEEHAGGGQYVHFGVLWWWMRLGILGPIGYLALLGTTVALALRVWRRSADGVIGAASLGTAAGLVGLAVAELTATFTGAEVRTSVLVGFVVGFIASAARITSSDEVQGALDRRTMP
jgi:hypothetical protein